MCVNDVERSVPSEFLIWKKCESLERLAMASRAI